MKNFISVEFPSGKFLEFPVDKIARNAFLRSGKKMVDDLKREMQQPTTNIKILQRLWLMAT